MYSFDVGGIRDEGVGPRVSIVQSIVISIKYIVIVGYMEIGIFVTTLSMTNIYFPQ